MAVVVESAWPEHPGYRIDLVGTRATARAWAGDRLLAESGRAVRVLETDHVERLYFPVADVRLELLTQSDHHTVCPFKGEADYWSLGGPDGVEDVFWVYRRPFDEVAGLRDMLGVYHEKVRVELESCWADGDRSTSRFPAWGDQDDLVRLLDAQPDGPGRFVAPGYHERTRNVVEGGQLLGAAIVAASKTLPDRRVTWASMTFARAADFDGPVGLDVEVLRAGRTFSSLSVRAEQRGALVAPALVLLDSGAPEVIHAGAELPPVDGPAAAEPLDMGVVGRALRVVDGAYDPDPGRVGPPVLDVWVRFRDDPAEPHLRQALLAQASTHWSIAAALRPHRGVGEADAHGSLSMGVLAVAMAFHDDAPLDGWLLYANRAVWSGAGLVQGEGTIFTEAGTLLASYSVQAMVRRFEGPAVGRDPSRLL